MMPAQSLIDCHLRLAVLPDGDHYLNRQARYRDQIRASVWRRGGWERCVRTLQDRRGTRTKDQCGNSIRKLIEGLFRKIKGPFPCAENSPVCYPSNGPRELWTDRDPVFDQVEGFFWNHVFCDQFTLHAIGAVAHDTIGLVLLQSEEENHVAR